jgi:hypothetical protein
MAKKAKLDILEITIDEGKEDKLLGDTIERDKGAEKSVERLGGEHILSKVKGWIRKPLFWSIILPAVVLGSLATYYIVLQEGLDEKELVKQKIPIDSFTLSTTSEKIVMFEGFVVDQKDTKGNTWIVFCDIAIELDKPSVANAINSDRIDLRDIIFGVLKKETTKEGLSVGGRARFKRVNNKRYK